MKYVVITLWLMAGLLLLGCSNDEGTGGEGPQVETLLASDYFPVEVGWQWTYVDSSSEGVDTSVNVIIADTLMDGYETYIALEDTETVYIQIREDGVYEIKDPMSFKMLPTSFNIGATWTIISYDSTWEEGGVTNRMSMEMTGSAVALEAVSTPAGDFSDCVKLELTGELELVQSVGGTDIFSYTESIHGYSWLAPGVGLVRSEDLEGGVVSVLISYAFEPPSALRK